MPAPPLKVPPALPAIHQKVPRQMGPHILTGPVAIKGAQPGQVLQVDIEAIDVFYDWGYNSVRPLAGALPDDFPETRSIHIVLDRAKKAWRLPWGQEIPLAPFFGVMATAPPPAWGMLSTVPPRRARPLPGIHVVQSGGRSARDAGRQRQQGHPRDARQAIFRAWMRSAEVKPMQVFSLLKEQEWDSKRHVEKVLGEIGAGDVT